MKAHRVMTRDVTCIAPRTSLADAHRQMTELRVRHLPVTVEGRLCGILSDRDLLVRAQLKPDGSLSFPDVWAVEAMTKNPITCSASASISSIVRLMIENTIDSVPVVHPDNKLVGLLTSTDLLELLQEPEQVSDAIPFIFNLRTPEERAA